MKVQAFNLENIDSVVTQTRLQAGFFVVAFVFALVGFIFLNGLAIVAWACWMGAGLLFLAFLAVRRRILLVHSGRTTIRREMHGDATKTRRLVDLIQQAKQAQLSQHAKPAVSATTIGAVDVSPSNEYAHPKYVEVRALFRLREEGLLTEAEYEEGKRTALGLKTRPGGSSSDGEPSKGP